MDKMEIIITHFTITSTVTSHGDFTEKMNTSHLDYIYSVMMYQIPNKLSIYNSSTNIVIIICTVGSVGTHCAYNINVNS